MKNTRWTQDEDEFLLRYHGVGADFVASHDLGRPDGAGERRLAKLTKTGARHYHAQMQLARLEYEVRAGFIPARHAENDLTYWAREAAETEAAA